MDKMTNVIEQLDPAAHALRPVRIVDEVAVHYTGTTFPRDPRGGCELTLRRCEAFGHLADPHPDLWIDVLDEHGDILQEVPISSAGFEYLRRTLQFRQERPGLEDDGVSAHRDEEA